AIGPHAFRPRERRGHAHARRPEQVEDCVGALKALDFSDAELAEIDTYARESDINLWAASAERKGPPRK
ncbi:hypothetical protein EN815_36165, partial [Mesorhizobium sp. M4B.F.Ca.ET.172.01.1.1]